MFTCSACSAEPVPTSAVATFARAANAGFEVAGLLIP